MSVRFQERGYKQVSGVLSSLNYTWNSTFWSGLSTLQSASTLTDSAMTSRTRSFGLDDASYGRKTQLNGDQVNAI